MATFVPEYKFRNEQNFFFDFFPSRGSFTKFMRQEILTDDKYKDINDAFLAIVYYSFERLYRNKIVYEQEYFYQDFAREMFDKIRKLGLLYQLWMVKNDDDPFDMMNDNYNEWYKHNRTDDSQEKNNLSSNNATKIQGQEVGKVDVDTNANIKGKNTQSSRDETHNTEQSRSNDGSLQAPLALNDLDLDNIKVESEKETATGAQTSKNKNISDSNTDTSTDNKSDTHSKSQNNRENKSERSEATNTQRDNQAHSNTSTNDERKRNKLNKVDLINSFTDLDLQAGFNKFARSFQHLFSRMNAGQFRWTGYWETNFNQLDIPPYIKQDTPLSTIVNPNSDIGNIPKDEQNSEAITKAVIRGITGITDEDFFVGNIDKKTSTAYLVGDGKYQGYVPVKYQAI